MKKAFSLAEILITLMIIGVIAGMTIPTLRKDSTNKATATNLKKVYSELKQSLICYWWKIKPIDCAEQIY